MTHQPDRILTGLEPGGDARLERAITEGSDDMRVLQMTVAVEDDRQAENIWHDVGYILNVQPGFRLWHSTGLPSPRELEAIREREDTERTMECPVCKNTTATCPECGRTSAMGDESNCPKCKECNAPMDCSGCGRVVSAKLDGVIDFDQSLIPWQR